MLGNFLKKKKDNTLVLTLDKSMRLRIMGPTKDVFYAICFNQGGYDLIVKTQVHYQFFNVVK